MTLLSNGDNAIADVVSTDHGAVFTNNTTVGENTPNVTRGVASAATVFYIILDKALWTTYVPI